MIKDKHEIRSTKFETSQKFETSNSKPSYDLEARTLKFAKNVRNFSREVRKDIANSEDLKQLIRSSGSIGANYIEANDSLSKKDLAMRIKIAKKEAKESSFWLELLSVSESQEIERISLLRESRELMNILGAILKKIEEKK